MCVHLFFAFSVNFTNSNQSETKSGFCEGSLHFIVDFDFILAFRLSLIRYIVSLWIEYIE